MVEFEAECFPSYSASGISRATVAGFAKVNSGVGDSLCLCSRNGYLIVCAILARIVNLVSGTIIEITIYLEIKKCCLDCWRILAFPPNIVIILYVDIVTSFPIKITSAVVHCSAAFWGTCRECSQILVVVAIRVCRFLRYIFIGTGRKRQHKTAKSCERLCLK